MLLRFDEDIARRTSRRRCECGGVLNVANFLRSPRGMPLSTSAAPLASSSLRFSFCCSKCRRRTTPPSLRFQGRSWYFAPARLLTSVMNREHRLAVQTLRRKIGISPRTISRWRYWWNHRFRASPQWAAARGYLRPSANEGGLPDSILSSSITCDEGSDPNIAIVAVLRILAAFVDVTRFPRVPTVLLDLRRV